MKRRVLIGTAIVTSAGLLASASLAGPPKPPKLDKSKLAQALSPLKSVAVTRVKRAAKKRAPKLSPARKAALMKIAAAQLGAPFTLGPQQTYHPRHGSVDSVGMNLIAGANTFISTGRPENAVAAVKLRNLRRGRKYLAECFVSSGPGGRGKIVYRPGLGLASQTLTPGRSSSVSLVFTAQQTHKELLVAVSGGSVWGFQGCTITPQR